MHKSKKIKLEINHSETLSVKINYYEDKLQELYNRLSSQQEELLSYSNHHNSHKIECPDNLELKNGSDKIIDLIKKKMAMVNQEINNNFIIWINCLNI